MSTATRFVIPAVCSLALALTVVPSVPAQQKADDRLRDVQQRREIEAQRVEKEVKEGREYAYRLARTDLDASLERLKDLLDLLAKDTSLSEDRRDLIVRYLRKDQQNVQAIAARERVERDRRIAVRIDREEARRTEDPRRTADGKQAYKTAAGRVGQMDRRVADARGTRDQTGDRFLGVGQQIDKSAVLPASDYDLPPDWLEKSKRRSTANKLTEKERTILEGLRKPTSVDYNNEPFSAVINYLSKVVGQPIVVDKMALEEVNVTYDTPITLQYPKPVSVRTALKRILSDLNLTYVIRNETIEVTSITRAREMLTTRTYYIGDLVGVYNPFLTPGLNQQLMVQNVLTLMNSIVAQVDPSSWAVNGGLGTISFNPVTMTIIVRQTAELHMMLGGGH
jgi:hypothetical protein